MYPVKRGPFIQITPYKFYGQAAQAFRPGLLYEWQLFVMPVVAGGGKSALPADTRLNCELIGERKLESRVVFLHYRTSTDG